MGVVSLDGTLIAQPPSSCEGSFPSSVTSIAISLNSGCPSKAAPAQTGAQIRTLNNPSAFVTLTGVGSSDAVAKADTLFFRSPTSVIVRLTFSDSSAAIFTVKGTLLLEFDSALPLTLLEAKGSGVVEWFASGAIS